MLYLWIRVAARARGVLVGAEPISYESYTCRDSSEAAAGRGGRKRICFSIGKEIRLCFNILLGWRGRTPSLQAVAYIVIWMLLLQDDGLALFLEPNINHLIRAETLQAQIEGKDLISGKTCCTCSAS